MPEIIAYCGLVCSECPTYLATQQNDDQARARVAEEWSRQYQREFQPADINCDGCPTTGKKLFGYCQVCEIRQCASGRTVVNCAYCLEYPCPKLSLFLSRAPQAREKLEAIRKQK